tara:strand:+ start:31813 stop:32712 length:900 start_codon:yes stop_codon:yes gene_type:complete
MFIGIIVNPKSGRNKAQKLAERCQQLLMDRSHSVLITNPHDLAPTSEIWNTERLIIIGGDGTVHHALPNLIKHQIPFYHLGTGTSNLIAKELKMPKNSAAAVNWIEQGGQTNLDVPTLDGVPFLIMCSFGMDAGVIHRFEQSRTKSGGFRNYILPVTKEFFNPRPASIRIEYDDETAFDHPSANLTIANMHSYALSIDPCPQADPTDGLLDILATRCTTTLNWSLQTNLSRFRIPIPNAHRHQTAMLQVHAQSKPIVAQFDGEIANTPAMPSGILELGNSVTIKISDYRVPVITKPNPA